MTNNSHGHLTVVEDSPAVENTPVLSAFEGKKTKDEGKKQLIIRVFCKKNERFVNYLDF